MDLSIGLSYKAVFTFLDYYWENNQNEEDLGELIRAMDPFLWENGSPADKTVVKDFISIVKGIDISKDEVGLDEGFGIMISFLEQQLSWLKLGTTIERLKVIYEEQRSEEWTFWIDNWLQTTENN